MTLSTPEPAKVAAADPVVSMNDTLPSGNPSLRSVLIFVGVGAAAILAFLFRSSLGL